MNGKSGTLLLLILAGVATLLWFAREPEPSQEPSVRAQEATARLQRERIPEPEAPPARPLSPVGMYFLDTSGRPIAGARAFFFDRDGALIAERRSRQDGGIDVRGVSDYDEVKIAKSGYGVTVVEAPCREIRTWAMAGVDVVAQNVPSWLERKYELWVGEPGAYIETDARWIPGAVPLEGDRARFWSGEDVRLIGRDRVSGLFVPLDVKPMWRGGVVFDLAGMSR